MIVRHAFDVSTDTGTLTLHSPPVYGEILQAAWHRSRGDTGGNFSLVLLQDSDTGIPILECGLTPGLVKAPRQPACAPDGFDTGVDAYVPFAAALERLRLTVTPTGAALAGRLFVWSRGP
jgi:hypothetical protein